MLQRWTPALLVCAAAWSLAGCQPAASSAPQSVAASSAPPSLAAALQLPSAQPDERYEFALGACTGTSPSQQCEFTLKLVRGGAQVATLPLDPVWSTEMALVAASAVQGAGDPLAAREQWQTWRVGSGDTEQAMAARRVRVAPGVEGVLLRRVHAGAARDSLLLRQQDQLSVHELPGRWSALAVRPGADRDRLLLLARAVGTPGFVWASEAVWDAATGSLRPDSEHDPEAHLAVLGPYPSAEAAQPVATCWSDAVILASDVYEGLPPKATFVGVVSSDAVAAQAALVSAQRCAAGAGQSVLPLRFRWQARERYALGEGQHAEVGLGRYDGEGWPLRVALLRSGRELARRNVSWPASTPVMLPTREVGLPAGDPLKPERGGAGWALGNGEGTALVAIRTLRLDAERSGLLVSMQAGFEHLTQRHDLLVVNGDQLALAWSAVAPHGPGWSSVLVRARAGGTDELLHFVFFADSQLGEPDRAEVTRLGWDAQRRELVADASACTAGVFSSVTGAFPSFAAALAARDRGCAAPPGEQGSQRHALVFNARPGGRGYALAQLSTDKALLGRLKTRAAECGAGTQTSLLEWCKRESTSEQ